MGDGRFQDNLQGLFDPRAVAVVGASGNPGKLGYHVLNSLIQGGFQGPIIPVNPGSGEILGLPTFPSVTAYGGEIDLAVIVLPAGQVAPVLEGCIQKGVKGMVLITAGFKEIDDPEGGALQSRLAELVRAAGVPVIGPNTFGMVNLHKNLNASFTPEFSRAEKGSIAVVSQSGGFSHLLAFMAMGQGVRLAKVVGLGNRLNVDFAEMVPYLIEDADTQVIVLYIEGLDHPRALMDAVEAGRGKKPIVVLKTGASTSGDRASLSHTGSIAGKQEIYEGALRQAGAICVRDSEDMLDVAQALSVCPLPQGPGVAILTAQAGPGMAACDVCEAEGLHVVPFRAESQASIDALLPPLAIRTNPVDMGPAWYSSFAIRGIVETVMDAEEVDGIILLMMFASANRTAVSDLSDVLYERRQKKPVVTCLVSPPGIWDGVVEKLGEARAIVNLPTPERAAKVMACLWRYKKMLKMKPGGKSGRY